MTERPLRLWTIYEHPLDYPHHFLVRLFEVNEGGIVQAVVGTLVNSLEEARAEMPWGLACLHRQEGDDPSIVETWL
jgi:hypothetical protein